MKLKAFTIVELIVVLGIIAVLMSATFAGISAVQKTSRDSTRKIDTNILKAAFEEYYANFLSYPSPDKVVLNSSQNKITIYQPNPSSDEFRSLKFSQNTLSNFFVNETDGTLSCKALCQSSTTANNWGIGYSVGTGGKPQEYTLVACLESGISQNFGSKPCL